jgi:PAS domain-containing protein
LNNTPVTVAGGIKTLQQQAAGWEWLGASIILFDRDGRVLYSNPAAELLVSRLYQSADTRPDRRGLQSMASFAEVVQDSCAGAVSTTFNKTFYYDRNIPVQLTLVVRPVIDQDDGQCEGAVVTVGEEQVDFNGRHLARSQVEIMELKARIRQLSASQSENERHIRLLLSEIPLPLIMFNSERKLTQINRSGEKLFGVQRRYSVGKACDQFLSCFADCGNSCPVLDYGEQLDLDEMVLQMDSSSSHHLLRTAVPLMEAGEAVVVEVFVDISDRKKIEQQAARYRQELEALVSRRTAKLRDYNRELESFSYTVSHDLRTPLRAIDGFSHALMEDYREVLDEQGIEYISKVRNAAQRMGLLIDDLLRLSRVTRQPLCRESVELSRIA